MVSGGGREGGRWRGELEGAGREECGGRLLLLACLPDATVLMPLRSQKAFVMSEPKEAEKAPRAEPTCTPWPAWGSAHSESNSSLSSRVLSCWGGGRRKSICSTQQRQGREREEGREECQAVRRGSCKR